MHVFLKNFTPNPESVVAYAACLCYSPHPLTELNARLTPEKEKELVHKVISSGHLSVLEHAVFTFAVEGVSRALTHQLVRHRLASYSQKSQRWVEEKNAEYIIPPSIKVGSPAYEIFQETMKFTCDSYAKLLEAGIPKEDARYVLPNAVETKIVVTMNARELLHFFSLRCCNRAQWEIRELAHTMLSLVREVASTIFANAGAPCVRGDCPEGDMSCGRPYTH